MRIREVLTEANIINPKSVDSNVQTMLFMIHSRRHGVGVHRGQMLSQDQRQSPWDDWATKRFRQIVYNDPQYHSVVGPKSMERLARGVEMVNGQETPVEEWVQKAAQRGDQLVRIISSTVVQALRERIAHVTDWFNALEKVSNDPAEPPAGRRDAKLLLDKRDRYTVDIAEQKANQWFARRQQNYHEHLEETGTKPVMEFGDGYRWVQITDPGALVREGSLMQHCVGGGGYDDELTDGSIRIYSLRDPQNTPHVTIEIQTGGEHVVISQIKGKQDEIPVPKYRPYVFEILNKLKPTSLNSYDLQNLNFVMFGNTVIDILSPPEEILLPNEDVIFGGGILVASTLISLLVN